ncbi:MULTISPECIES: GNAT family N-acetyltransferase [Streptomyces]|uniref:GNAT family N-acetyltransferase n=1 Tax=Streptomyces venezuelae TaxID=54571 RepID=A0A5P2BB64_STRVZ|nr:MULTISPECIES: GNAT family N-acetyltransferase [Streptomyces]NEA01852.1 GNAT family N-acetyltransferase [Streptomyces sp. SID10116]MYY81540.1 GNAT family N-acetyltransferase [Streptomyces sp. SID335]MYZ19167.1 GNAT family N-acetyltransferase [Streptomyces sp. SID337]NDZ88386.1 GNAT family N-acetyltransferase [Streptomyces sp. SID10115]NEB49178.1 GNAT family N-acetyltransferase [Streptomyces sp. SID339]
MTIQTNAADTVTATGIHLRTVTFAHPDAVRLNDLVQLEYAERYGDEGDLTPLDPTMFEPPRGRYFIAYDEHGTALATGGWRGMDENEENYRDGDAELKRMFVTAEARGLGLARRILAALEADAKAAGRVRMVLETGTKQPEAIALYTSSGYTPAAEKFGLYRFDDLSRCYEKLL